MFNDYEVMRFDFVRFIMYNFLNSIRSWCLNVTTLLPLIIELYEN